MPTKIVVPELGESIVEATVVRWLKQEGDQVVVGEVVVELETEKVNLEVGAEEAGILARIERQEGEDVEIGDVLGLIEPAPAADETTPDQKEQTAPEKEPVQETPENNKTPSTEAVSPEKSKGTDTRPEQPAKESAEKMGAKATPVAERLATEHHVDLSQVFPRSPGERVTKQDVEDYLKQQVQRPKDKPAETKPQPETKAEQEPAPGVPSPDSDGRQREKRVRLSRRRRTIARRLVEVQQTAAILTTFNEIDMNAVIEIRQRRRETFQEQHGVKLGFMSFFVKAAIGALKQFPRLNAEIDGDEIILKNYYDIGMAIGAEEGLVVPVIREADRMTFAEIEQAIDTYAQKAQEGTLSIEDLRGGTFTITNGGVFGSLLSTPILNPPQVGILGLHKIEKRPVVLNDEVVIRPMMYLALSYDHRIVDGREAVQFLVRIKTLLEDPEVLLLEG
jgi:2-oxoglutarate dehydrogenase E2 component (dihydrolipoamide succinyltransferase)